MIENLIKSIEEANFAYRIGESIITDEAYDQLVEQLKNIDPANELLDKIGLNVSDLDRKSKLPIEMASMNKLKTIEDVNDWLRLKNLRGVEFILTPKFDGVSLCTNEKNAWTRGDGEFGQRSDEHFNLISNKLNSDSPFEYTNGEVMISRKKFQDIFSEEFENPRNLVAGLLNSKTISAYLKDSELIRYGATPKNKLDFSEKSQILDKLNELQDIKVSYELTNSLSEELLIDLFKKWSVDYTIDGVIIEVNSLKIQEDLGRENSTNNPCYARAFKHDSFEEKAESVVTGITWNISKQGLLKPVLQIKPIRLDGVTVSNVTANNAKFVKEMGLGIGAKVIVKRSGMVIPMIVSVIEAVPFVMPLVKGTEVIWNENGIELITTNETEEQKLRQVISFFEILGADNVGEGVITQLSESGFKTIESILNLVKDDLEKIDRFGKRKAKIVFDSIKKATSDVELSKLQHATGIFKGLGSRKLINLEHFLEKPTIEEVMNIEGFAEISAKSYVEGYDLFFNYIKTLPISIKKKTEINKVNNDLDNCTFVFTGVRRADLEEILISRGAKIGSSVSKNSTHLVCKDKNSGSSKLTKAISFGVEILDISDLEKKLKV